MLACQILVNRGDAKRGTGETCPPTSHQGQFYNSTEFDETMLGEGVRSLLQDFEMSVAARLRNKCRV